MKGELTHFSQLTTLPSRVNVTLEQSFPSFHFLVPVFEFETVWDVNTRSIPSASLDRWWILSARTSLERVSRQESWYFESNSPFSPLKSYSFWAHSDVNIAQNKSWVQVLIILNLETQSEPDTSPGLRDSPFQVRDERLGKFCFGVRPIQVYPTTWNSNTVAVH